jgi:hypothetical protein
VPPDISADQPISLVLSTLAFGGLCPPNNGRSAGLANSKWASSVPALTRRLTPAAVFWGSSLFNDQVQQ